ncbi:YlxM family DNA-binding protein [Floccifex sp.]|uniref:YlxM family DNA-binding protein n=1 Tax=Floccifex sp. TaxID=2815810 RepID=UPI002A752F76|nr:sigma factor-like helix-turn-helix DNA-binding protein [Floccifex sp.]MDD7281424.1 sigma factor-like helix-turn-helix DNA-binding protein [Erysipelotrichaceae bacterium]MDY2957804.1 sigma factor-like helix-turn-helix DNA-binding protein [Floccifex sp.]
MLDRFVLNELFDVYGELLTPRQQEILQLYVQEDLSYAEISEELSISRSAVLDAVHKSISQLEKYESVIQYLSKKKQLQDLVASDKELSKRVNEIF